MAATGWPAIESDPTVLNAYTAELGMDTEKTFTELFSLDEDSLSHLSSIDAVFAVVKRLEPENDKEKGEQDPSISWIQQPDFLGDACGLVAILNFLFNRRDLIQSGSLAEHLIKSLGPLSPEDRAVAINSHTKLKELHAHFASEGVTAMVDSSEFHWVVFLNEREGVIVELDGTKQGPLRICHKGSFVEGLAGEISRRVEDGEIDESIDVKGFRSYRDHVNIPLRRGFNVIVGHNGHGKSNLLQALKFVIAGRDINTSQAKFLLHEGSGRAVLQAQVDVNFCHEGDPKELAESVRSSFQSASKLSPPKDSGYHITFSRRMTAKKNDWMVNHRIVKVSEFEAHLCALGFSNPLNPYYIIQQGRIQEVARQADNERLGLLKEAAGITTYNERREVCLQELEVTQQRTRYVGRIHQDTASKLEDLKRDQREADKVRLLRKRYRLLAECMNRIERSRHANDLMKTQEDIRGARARRSELMGEEAAARETLITAMEETDTASAECEETAIRQLKGIIDDQNDRIANAESAYNPLKAKVATMSRELKERLLELERRKHLSATATGRLVEIESQFKCHRTELSAIQSELDGKELFLSEAQEELRRLEEFLQSMDDVTAYASVAERNEALDRQIATGEEELKRIKISVQEATSEGEEIDVLMKQAGDPCRSVEESGALARHVELKDGSVARYRQEHRTLCDSVSTLNLRLESMRKSFTAHDGTVLSRDGPTPPASFVCGQLPGHLREALGLIWREAVNKNFHELIYGTLMDCVEIRPFGSGRVIPFEAAEVAGERSWNNLLVADHETAIRLSTLLKGGGRSQLTVTPVSNLAERKTPIVLVPPDGYTPLLQVLKYEKRVAPAVEQIFGRWLLIDDINEAKGNRFGDWNCVTFSGETVEKSGVLTGGNSHNIIGRNLSRIHNERKQFEDLLEAESQLSTLIAEKERVVESLATAETEADQQLQIVREQREIWKKRSDEVRDIREELEKRASQNRTHLAAANANWQSKESLIRHLRQQRIAPTLDEASSPERRAQVAKSYNEKTIAVDSTLRDRAALRIKLSNISEHCDRLEEERETVRQQVTSEFDDHSSTDDMARKEMLLSESVERQNRTLQQLNQERERKEVLVKGVKLLEATSLTFRDTKRRIRRDIDFLDVDIAEWSAEIQRLERLLGGGDTGKENEAKLNDKLLQEGLEEFISMDLARLRSTVLQVKLELESVGPCNEAAIEQLQQFEAEYENVMAQKEQMVVSGTKIRDLLEHLDRQRVESFKNAFQTVSQEFSKVFREIVPQGKARLKIVDPSTDNKLQGNFELDVVQGIGITASFTGKRNSFHRMAAFSGGQRTVIAVALIFALQRFVSAPLYLLDEIDAALDDAYRGAVANVIKESANTAQFVATTFRRQLAETGAYFIKVGLRDKLSEVFLVTREEALRVIDEVVSTN